MDTRKMYAENRFEPFGKRLASGGSSTGIKNWRDEQTDQFPVGRSDASYRHIMPSVRAAFEDPSPPSGQRYLDPTKYTLIEGDNGYGHEIKNLIASAAKLGRVLTQASKAKIAPAPLTGSDYTYGGASGSKLYDGFIQLGMYKFGNTGVTFDFQKGISFEVEYPIVYAMDSSDAGTYILRHKVSEPVTYSSKSIDRVHVHMTRAEVSQARWKASFQEFLVDGSMSRDKLARAVGLPKTDIGSLNAGIIQKAARVAVGSNRVARYTKLFGMMFALSASDAKIVVNVNAEIKTDQYDAINISKAAEMMFEENSGALFYLETVDDIPSHLIAFAALPFPAVEVLVGGRAPRFGGFYIPGEIELGGKVTILHKHGQHTRNEAKPVGAADVYRLICRYAQSTQSYADCYTGYNIALSLLVSDCLPSFSLPKSQGLTDLFAPCLQEEPLRELPPFKVNKMAVLGAFAANRQVIMLGKDLLAHMHDPRNPELPVPVSDYHSRQAIYNMAMHNMFTDAFNIHTHIDPLHNLCGVNEGAVVDVEYLDTYWTVCRVGRIISRSFMQFALHGQWCNLPDLARQPKARKQESVATWATLGIIPTKYTPSVKKLKSADLEGSARYIEFRDRIPTGPITIHPGGIRPGFRKMSSYDTLTWKKLPKHANEDPEALVVEGLPNTLTYKDDVCILDDDEYDIIISDDEDGVDVDKPKDGDQLSYKSATSDVQLPDTRTDKSPDKQLPMPVLIQPIIEKGVANKGESLSKDEILKKVRELQPLYAAEKIKGKVPPVRSFTAIADEHKLHSPRHDIRAMVSEYLDKKTKAKLSGVEKHKRRELSKKLATNQCRLFKSLMGRMLLDVEVYHWERIIESVYATTEVKKYVRRKHLLDDGGYKIIKAVIEAYKHWPYSIRIPTCSTARRVELGRDICKLTMTEGYVTSWGSVRTNIHTIDAESLCNIKGPSDETAYRALWVLVCKLHEAGEIGEDAIDDARKWLAGYIG